MGRRSLDSPAARRQHDEDDEREEPRDVEVEPVRQRELEADQDGTGESGELESRLAARDEVAGDRARHEQADRRRLEKAEVRDPRRVVLAPAPDREGGVAADLPAEGAGPEDAGGSSGARLQEQDRERYGGRRRKSSCKYRLSGESARFGIGRPERDEQQRGELRPPCEREERPAGESGRDQPEAED